MTGVDQQKVPGREQTLPHEGYGLTWAKTILIGEHSVVYGYPALALPLRSLKMQAWVTPLDSGEHSHLQALNYSGSLEQSGEAFGGLRRAVEVALDFVGHPEQAFIIRTEADFPSGRGLGSSAAAAGAVVGAILDAFDTTVTREQFLELTNQAENITHGRPSGVDAATTSGLKPVRLESGNITTVEPNGSAYLVIADTGVAGSTKEAVEGVHSRLESDPVGVRKLLESLGSKAQYAIEDLEAGRMEPLGARMDEVHDLLNELGVGHPQLDELVETARSHGALGAKLTGGGLGGCILALAKNSGDANAISHALKANGAQEVWIHPLAA